MFGRRRIFLSHSSNDDALASALLAGLTKRRLNAFTDHDEKQGIVPGEAWLAALSRQLKHADAVLILISDAWRLSQWCQVEYKTAKLLDKPVIPVVIGAGHGDIEPSVQRVVLQPRAGPTEAQLDAIVARCRGGCLVQRSPWPPYS
jgi:hypothetical protein